MQKLNLLFLLLALIFISQNSHAGEFFNDLIRHEQLASGVSPYSDYHSALSSGTTIATSVKTVDTQKPVTTEQPATTNSSWFAIKPLPDSVSIFLMILGLGLVYLADYRKKKSK